MILTISSKNFPRKSDNLSRGFLRDALKIIWQKEKPIFRKSFCFFKKSFEKVYKYNKKSLEKVLYIGIIGTYTFSRGIYYAKKENRTTAFDLETNTQS